MGRSQAQTVTTTRPRVWPPGDQAGDGLAGALLAPRRALPVRARAAVPPDVCRHHWHQQDRLITGVMSSKRSLVAGRTPMLSAPLDAPVLDVMTRAVCHGLVRPPSPGAASGNSAGGQLPWPSITRDTMQL